MSIGLARQLALDSTENQFDKSGKNYFYHLECIANNVSVMGECYEVVAYLHDIVEDGHISLVELSKLGFSNEIIIALEAISKMKGEQYQQYLERVIKNEIAMVVKIADLLDNMNIFRLSNISDKDIQRCRKYANAYCYLLSEI